MIQKLLFSFKNWFRRVSGEEERDEIIIIENSTRALNMEDAKSLALQALGNYKWSFVRETPQADELESFEKLGNSLHSLFSEYSRVDNLHTNFRLRREMIKNPYAIRKFIHIGETYECSHIVALPHEDTIFIMDDMEEFDDETVSYPSIYHLIVYEAALVESIKFP